MEKELICEIDFEKIIQEVSIFDLSMKKLGILKLYVYPKEGPIPHFHLIGNDFETCICLYNSLYFLHGSKTDTLNKNQLKELDKVLRSNSKNPKYQGYTNWQVACIIFDINNNTNFFNYSLIQPDYTKTKESIH